jgi:hypothetical protein
MSPAGGLPGASAGFPAPLHAAHAWPNVPCVGDLIPAGFELIDAGGRRYRAAVLRGHSLRLLVVARASERRFELLIDARGRVLEVHPTQPPRSQS